MVDNFYTTVFFSLGWMMMLLWVGCSNAEIRDHQQLQQSFHQIDSVGIPDYNQPIELRKKVLGEMKSFIAAYPTSQYTDSLKELHRVYTDEIESLLAEQLAFQSLQEQVDATTTLYQVEECRTTLTNFETSFPNSHNKTELDDINRVLSFVKNVEVFVPDSIANLNDLNMLFNQSNILLAELKGEKYISRIQHRIRLLDSRRQIVCENEIKVKMETMEEEMEVHATNEFRANCICLNIPKFIKKFVGLKTPKPTLKNSKREDQIEEIFLSQTYEFKGPGGTLCSETRLFTIEVVGTVNKNCGEGIPYSISADMTSSPIIIE